MADKIYLKDVMSFKYSPSSSVLDMISMNCGGKQYTAPCFWIDEEALIEGENADYTYYDYFYKIYHATNTKSMHLGMHKFTATGDFEYVEEVAHSSNGQTSTVQIPYRVWEYSTTSSNPLTDAQSVNTLWFTDTLDFILLFADYEEGSKIGDIITIELSREPSPEKITCTLGYRRSGMMLEIDAPDEFLKLSSDTENQTRVRRQAYVDTVYKKLCMDDVEVKYSYRAFNVGNAVANPFIDLGDAVIKEGIQCINYQDTLYMNNLSMLDLGAPGTTEMHAKKSSEANPIYTFSITGQALTQLYGT